MRRNDDKNVQRIIRSLLPCFALLIVMRAGLCGAQERFPARELSFERYYGQRKQDPTTYILLGSGFIRPMTTDIQGDFIKEWVAAHPDALAVPICSERVTAPGRTPSSSVYIWIEDKEQSLNVDLIREGIFPGGVMGDLVAAEAQYLEELRDPKRAAERVRVEKDIAATPAEDLPKRLVSDADFSARLKRIEEAEAAARKEKKGVWSDDKKEERETEGWE